MFTSQYEAVVAAAEVTSTEAKQNKKGTFSQLSNRQRKGN